MSSRAKLMVNLALGQTSSTSNSSLTEKEDLYDIAESNVTDFTELKSYMDVETQSFAPDQPLEDMSVEREETSEEEEPFQDSGSSYVPSECNSAEEGQNLSTADVSDEERRSQNLSDEEQQQQHADGRKRSRKTKGQGDPSTWKRAKNSRARLMGETYIGFRKDTSGKYKQTIEKEKRELGPVCVGHPRTSSRGPKQKFECATISEEERRSIFDQFWSINSWEGEKIYVSALVSHCQPKCRRKATRPEESRKQIGFQYHLNATAGTEKVKRLVCKKMFLSTLGIKERTVRLWRIEKDTSSNTEDQNGETQPPIKECSNNIRDFLNSLPKVESHYCRASSRKLYLEPLWTSYRHLHREFVRNCEMNGKRSSSWRTFLKTFRATNLEIYTPKKDQCNSCIMYKNGNLEESVYDKHINRKNEARAEKSNDKSVDDENTYAYAVDLQAVLLSPRLGASAIYYKTKLKVHNLTFYNMKNKDVTCYLWHESSGDLESDVFTSIMVKFLRSEMQTHKPTRIILWSDGCCYQNRNVKLSNGFLELAAAENVIIQQKYLEVGHTQMEVDSIHSTIERQLGRRREVCVPADYIHIIRSARQNPSPYKVIQLPYQDFYKYDGGVYTSIRPGTKKADSCVTNICALQYTVEGIINYKLNFNELWKELPRRQTRKSSKLATPARRPHLYDSPRPIELTKFGHLQELKSLMSADYHEFYNTLNHNCGLEECTHIRVRMNQLEETDK